MCDIPAAGWSEMAASVRVRDGVSVREVTVCHSQSVREVDH